MILVLAYSHFFHYLCRDKLAFALFCRHIGKIFKAFAIISRSAKSLGNLLEIKTY